MTGAEELFRSVSDQHHRCFWLDRLDARGWSTPGSLIGWLEDDDVSLTYDAAARTVTRWTAGTSKVVGDDIFAVLEREIGLGPTDARWVGYLGYSARPDLPALTGSDVPDAVWMCARHTRVLPAEPLEPAPSVEVEVEADALVDPETYTRAFDEVQRQLRAGNSYEVNLTYRANRHRDLDPRVVYGRLRRLSPAPYGGLVQHDVEGAAVWLLSSSPERFARVDADRTLESRPIKGTTPRGRTRAEDEGERERLASEPKFRAENLMIVDLMRNDLGQVCAPGSVSVPRLMEVESYANVHQLVSTVQGTLRPEVSTVAALHALFPPGSMTGAPKLRTMEIIVEVEVTPRGPYAGAFGWISPDGTAELGVVIRSLVTGGNGDWTLGTGGGVIVRSDLDDELGESVVKASRLLACLADDDIRGG